LLFDGLERIGLDKDGNADIGSYLWFGRFMVLLAGLLEFFLGNTFACTLFFGFGKLGF